MQRPKITVAIIAKNEEARIARCLESVKWADEIVVVDGFSTDKTADIARSFGAKVVPHRFTGAFADERNAGMENASNDWVLHLDADEIVTEDFRDKAAQILAREEDVAVYKFKRINYFLGHRMDHGGFHHYIPNLVNRKFVKFEGLVHEVPVHNGNIATIEAAIEHYPFGSIGQFIERQNRYAQIAAQDLLKREGALSQSEIRKGLVNRSFKIFWKSYVKKQGYKDGMYGLVFAVLFAFINFLKWAKYWELVKNG